MSSLKSFIKSVRSTRTLAEERAVIQKESAAIRTSFREQSHDPNVRRKNVAKLLYLFTMGEKTHFGQIECLKLLASPRFADKRLGYLGTMLLLDENQEVLTLVTNSLQNDLNHPNQYIVGLALCTLGNIASQEMARDLFQQVESLLNTSNPYIRRKAALCAMRIIRKAPDLQEHFVEKAKLLINDRNHGVLLCALTLITDLCVLDPDLVDEFRQYVPLLIRQLKSITTAGYAPEHDVTGITDPFLQVKILSLLRVLGQGDAATSEQMNDILTEVVSNTDASKNVGNSILYEATLTILEIDADSALRVLGINILGKFLANKDNNIRYVALNTLTKVVGIEPNAVQRHRNTILDCLRDPDISIRRRAMDLSFTLINESNVRVLVRELLAFLEVANTEFKSTLTSQICTAADRFAPTKRWHIDTVLRVLKLAGNYVKEEILATFIRLVATTSELQTYTVQKLYSAMKSDISQEALVLAGAWTIGEFADRLLAGGSYEEEDLVQKVNESEIIDVLEGVLLSTFATQVVQEYVIVALVKVTTHTQAPAQIERVRRILLQNTNNVDVEIQQRAMEFGNLFGQDAQLRKQVLERMPPPAIREEVKPIGKPTVPRRRKNDLLDLEDGELDRPANTSAAAAAAAAEKAKVADLLSDLFGQSLPPSNPSLSRSPDAKSPGQGSNADDIMGLFGANSTTNHQPAAAVDQYPPITAYEQHNVVLTFQPVKESDSNVRILSRLANKDASTSISNFHLQAAVAKSQTLTLQPPSRTQVPPREEATQVIKVRASPGVSNVPLNH